MRTASKHILTNTLIAILATFLSLLMALLGRAREKFDRTKEAYIAELKRAESDLRAQKEFEESLVQHSLMPTFVIDANHRLLHWNRACEEQTGVMASEIIGTDRHWSAYYKSERRTLSDFVVDGAYEEAASCYPVLKRKGDGLFAEGWYPDLNGRDRYLCFYAAPIYNVGGETIAAIQTVEDITERQRTEEKLQQTLSLLSATLESTADGILVRDLAGKVLTFNGNFTKMWGFPEHVLATRDDARMREFVLDQLKSPEKFLEMTENLYLHPEIESRDIVEFNDGRTFERVTKPQVIEDEVIGRVISYRDVTERKKAEKELRESEELYRSLIENIDLGITLIDEDRRIIMTNGAVGKMFDKPAEEFFQQYCFREFEKRAEICGHCPGTVAMETGKPATVQTEGVREDGSSFIVRIRAFPVFDPNGKASRFIEVIQDITEQMNAENERKSLEAQLRQSQKLEAIGTLAGGIAHDFNNFLTAMSGYCSIMKTMIADDHPINGFLEKNFSAIDKAALLTKSLLAYSRKQSVAPRPVDLNEIVRKGQTLLSRLLREDMDLAVLPCRECLTVMADSLQIEQVLMNLAVNAKDAMPGGGILRIATDRLDLDDEFIKSHGFGTPGGYALLAVSDTGTGMDEKTRERIFEPFFTTKEVGKGTGLGLSVAFGIVKQHNGFINVYSEPGGGTVFKIYLPLSESAQADRKPEAISVPATGSETILLVEDNGEVRSTLKELLERHGYTIIEAVDGEDGVRQFRERGEEIQLLLLDVIMPKKNGKEAYEEIKKIAPGMKAIFISGYMADILAARGVLNEDVDLVSKPISLKALTEKIREVLDREMPIDRGALSTKRLTVTREQ